MQNHQTTSEERAALKSAAATIGALALVVEESVKATGAHRRARTPKQAHARMKARSEGSDRANALAEGLAVYAGSSGDPTFKTLRRGANGFPELLLLDRFTCSPRWKPRSKLTARQANLKYQVPDTHLQADLTLFDMPGQAGRDYSSEPVDLRSTSHLTVRIHRDKSGSVTHVSMDCRLGDDSLWTEPIVADLSAILITFNSWQDDAPWLQYVRAYGPLGTAKPLSNAAPASAVKPDVPGFTPKTRKEREKKAREEEPSASDSAS